MTLAYSADALIYIADNDSYALRPDFDPVRHRVGIEFGTARGWSADEIEGWNGADDPCIAQVRDAKGVPTHAGHAYVAERVLLTTPGGDTIHLDMLEIEHEPVGCVSDAKLDVGASYRVSTGDRSYRAPEDTPLAAGFGPGTMIATSEGDLPVEWLARGDEVLTLSDGLQPLRWIGHTRLGPRDFSRYSHLRPLCIAPDALAHTDQTRLLLIAPDTRVMLASPVVALNFGLEQALARAGDLFEEDEQPEFRASLTCFTLLFDYHQIIRANGLWCESLFAEPGVLDSLTARSLHPLPRTLHSEFALPCLRGWETRMIRRLRRPEIAPRRTAAA